MLHVDPPPFLPYFSTAVAALDRDLHRPPPPVPDRVLAEVFHVLTPVGRFAVSDVIVRGEIPPDIRRSVELWVGFSQILHSQILHLPAEGVRRILTV
jgi:hypothetical protein